MSTSTPTQRSKRTPGPSPKFGEPAGNVTLWLPESVIRWFDQRAIAANWEAQRTVTKTSDEMRAVLLSFFAAHSGNGSTSANGKEDA